MPTRCHPFIFVLFMALAITSPALARTITIFLTGSDSGNPVTGAKVEVYVDDHEEVMTSGSDGSVRIELPADGPKYGIRVTASAEKYLPTLISWKRKELNNLPEEYTLVLKQGLTIGGKIQDEKGKPVQHVKVVMSIIPLSTSKDRTVISDHIEWTNDQGEWRFDMAPEQMESVRLRLEHPYYITSEYFDYGQNEQRPIGPLKTFEDIIVLKKSLTLDGIVLDEDGQPLKGIKVSVPGSPWDQGRRPAAITDASGNFRFTQLSPGELTLTAEAEGYTVVDYPVTVGESNDLVKIRIKKGQTIRGRVLNPKGEPLNKVNISAHDLEDSSGDRDWQGFTNEEGRFEWNSAPNKPVNFSFYNEGVQRVEKELAPQEEEHVITLGDPLIVSGTVEDADTGAPLSSFRVIKGIGFEQRDKQIHWERYNQQISSGGKFTVSFDQPYPRHFIRIEAPGYEPNISRAFTDGEGRQNYCFKMKKGVTLSGFVVDSEGKPMPHLDVILHTLDSTLFIRSGQLESTQGCIVMSTDKDGKFTVDPQSETFALAVLCDQGVGQMDGKEFTEGSKIQIQPWGQIEGVVRVGSKPLKGEKISLTSQRTAGEERSRLHFNYEVESDDTGQFYFERVIPGDLSLARMMPAGSKGTRMSTADNISVTLAAGQTLTVEIGGRGRPVTGHIVVPVTAEEEIQFGTGFNCLQTVANYPGPIRKLVEEGTEEAVKLIREWNKSPEGKAFQSRMHFYSFPLNADGTFRVEDVEAGNYELLIQINKAGDVSDGGPGKQQAMVRHKFQVPEMPNGRSDEPLNLGDLPLFTIQQINVGDAMPPIKLHHGDQKITVNDYKGKVVVLNFTIRSPKQQEGEDPIPDIMKSLVEIPGATENLVILRIKIGSRSTESENPLIPSGLMIDCSMDPEEMEINFQRYRIDTLLAQLIIIDRQGTIQAIAREKDIILDVVGKAIGK